MSKKQMEVVAIRRRGGRKRAARVDGVSNSVRKPTVLGNFRTVGFPDEYRCLLKYNMSESIGIVSGGIYAQQFRANSLFDPDFTNTGHQPTYFDQLSTVYGRYYVRACKAKVTIVPTGSALPIQYCITVSDSALATLNNMDAFAEAPYSWSGVVSTLYTRPTTINTPMIHTSKVMGQKETEPDNNMYANVGNNPNDVWWIEVFCQAIDKAGNTNGYIKVELEFECMFKDLTSPGSSLMLQKESQPKQPVFKQQPEDTVRRKVVR